MTIIDLTDTPESSNTIPNGKYNVVCTDAEIRQTRAGTGEYISCQFKVMDGDHAGFVLFHQFNIKNPNPKAVQIGLGQLKSFMRCAGQTDFKLQDVNELIGLKASASVKIQVSDGYDDRSVISGFKPLETDPNEETPVAGGASPF